MAYPPVGKHKRRAGGDILWRCSSIFLDIPRCSSMFFDVPAFLVIDGQLSGKTIDSAWKAGI